MSTSRLLALAMVAVTAAACASTPPAPPTPGPSGVGGLPTSGPATIGSSVPGGPPATGPVAGVPSNPPAAPASPPSRRELIAQALAAGRIDQVTSLRYRAAALLKLPELPDEFATAPSRGDDSALFDEIVDLLPTLSPRDQHQLRPFIVRPTEPDSIFAASRTPMTASLTGAVVTTAAAGNHQCTDWADSGAASATFKVWACEAGGDGAAAARDIATTTAVPNEIWTPMTKPPPSGMGPPIPDATGPNFPPDVSSSTCCRRRTTEPAWSKAARSTGSARRPPRGPRPSTTARRPRPSTRGSAASSS